MSFPRLCALVFSVFAIGCQLVRPTVSHAATYQIIPLGIDNRSFVGMDDAGHVVFDVSWFTNCPSYCYQVYENGVLSINEVIGLPSYNWDYSVTSGIHYANAPSTVSRNGWTATLSINPSDEFLSDLYVSSPGNPPQLLITAHDLGGPFAINGVGDIIFDGPTRDEWYEALNLDTLPAAPEPSSLILLLTGVAGAGLLLARRRATV